MYAFALMYLLNYFLRVLQIILSLNMAVLFSFPHIVRVWCVFRYNIWVHGDCFLFELLLLWFWFSLVMFFLGFIEWLFDNGGCVKWLLVGHKGWREFNTITAYSVCWFILSPDIAELLSSIKGILLVFTPKILFMIILLFDSQKLSALCAVLWLLFLFVSARLCFFITTEYLYDLQLSGYLIFQICIFFC